MPQTTRHLRHETRIAFMLPQRPPKILTFPPELPCIFTTEL